VVKREAWVTTYKIRNVKVKYIGGDRFCKKRCDVVQLSVQGSDGDVEISAVCFPKICLPIPTKICPERYLHLKGLNLADLNLIKSDKPEHDNIDIQCSLVVIIYFDIVNNEMVRGEGSGPVTVGSKFGWILSDPTMCEDMNN
jgi:hypothetical protein